MATTDEWSVIYTLFAHRMGRFLAYERLTNRARRASVDTGSRPAP